jgi:histidinol-phosphate aminotransferase
MTPVSAAAVEAPIAAADGDQLMPRAAVSSLTPSRQRYPETIWSMPGAVQPMHLNEGPWPPSPRVIAAIAQHAAEIFRYPMPQPMDLRSALAERCGVAASRIVLGNGSDELVQAITLAYLMPGCAAVMPAPSFPKYRQATQLMGADAIQVGLRADGCVDVGKLLAACTPATRMIFVPTPNNPTGGYLTTHDIQKLLERRPRGTLIVFDAAYHEFSVVAGAPDLISVLRASSSSWIVLRSFSKAYCLAGMRIGYAVSGDDAIAEALARVQPVFNITHLSRIAALAALGDRDHLAKTVSLITAERSRVRAALQTLGLEALPSATNFLAVKLDRPASLVLEGLRKRGILAAPILDRGYEKFLRITLGKPDENDRFLDALVTFLKQETPERSA